MYKIFAMEGLEKGCELEYYYTYKRDGTPIFGRGDSCRPNFPVLDRPITDHYPQPKRQWSLK